MQETGNNHPGNALEIMSIRLSPDGLSFTAGTAGDGFRSGQYAYEKGDTLLQGLGGFLSGDGFPQAAFEKVCLFPDTDRMVLVPEALWREELSESYLRTNGLTPRTQERIVVSPSVAGTRAVMLCDREIDSMLKAKFPGAFYLSPLQAAFAGGMPRSLTLLLTPTLVYATYTEETTQYAEALCYGGFADILCYLNRLPAEFDLSKAIVRVTGHQDATVTRQLKRYYRHVETADYGRLLYHAVKSVKSI